MGITYQTLENSDEIRKKISECQIFLGTKKYSLGVGMSIKYHKATQEEFERFGIGKLELSLGILYPTKFKTSS